MKKGKKKEDVKKKDLKKEDLKKAEEIKNEKNVSSEGNENNDSVEMVQKLEEENQKLKDEYLRKAAEFENYKRRTENEQGNLIKYAAEGFIINILPIFNDIERSLLHAEDDANTESFKKGITLVYENFKKTLEAQGVKKIECKGKPFDFNYHEALMQQPADNVPPHTVLEEIEPGFVYKDKVIKHAKVIVSQELVAPTAENNDSEE